MPKNKIFIMGPQGSGKGTQSELLAIEIGVPALSMGQLVRGEIATGSEKGKMFAEIINGGNLISDVDAANLLKVRLDNPDVLEGYILDGYPRNMDQYKAFDFDEPSVILVLEIPKEESIKRLSGRLNCDACGTIYAEKRGFKIGDKCDCEEGTLYRRDDDTPDAIEQRLLIYSRDTEPVIQKFEDRGVVVHRMSGMGSPEEVLKRMMEYFK